MSVKWRADGAYYRASMGPISLIVDRSDDDDSLWGYEFFLGDCDYSVGEGHHRKGVSLAKCKADAIAHVEKWRDSIKGKGKS